eukprot:scaffold74136_cov61-Attheya_sp.AAC.1
MGKQTRRKRTQKGRGGKGSGTSSNNSAIAGGDDAGSGTNAVLTRIRHADARTRHAALTALSATLVCPESLAKSTKLVTPQLRKAICERILDDDMEVSFAACGCMNNYVSFATSAAAEQEVAQLLGPIIQKRLETCCTSIAHQLEVAAATKSTTPMLDDNTPAAAIGHEKGKRKKKGGNKGTSSTNKATESAFHAVWAVTDMCLRVASKLIEVNPEGLQLLDTGTNQERYYSFLQAVMEVQKLSQTVLRDAPKQIWMNNEIQISLVQDSLMCACRSIHSALDENPEFAQTMLSFNNGDMVSMLTSIAQAMDMPVLARLHATGAIVALRQTVITFNLGNESVQKTLNDTICSSSSSFLALLNQCLVLKQEEASACAGKLVQAQEALAKEKEDSQIEKEVIQTIESKQESSRDIAKRQKERKAEKAAAAAVAKDTAALVNMEVNDEIQDDNAEEETPPKEARGEDKAETYGLAVDNWHELIAPIKLALEVTTNMCAGCQVGDVETFESHIGEDDDDIMWGSDDEAQLQTMQHDANANDSSIQLNPLDKVLFDAVVAAGLPERVFVLVDDVSQCLFDPNTKQLPNVVTMELGELHSKTGACLGNMICNISSWREDNQSIIAFWSTLCKAMSTLLSSLVTSSSNNIQGDSESPTAIGAGGLCNTMTISLRSRPNLRTNIGSSDLDLILNLLTKTGDAAIQRDAATMLGILCNEVHPDEINAKVCTSLLSVLSFSSTNVMVRNEILNVLMDVYGDDELYAKVFEQKDVLGHFQQSLP